MQSVQAYMMHSGIQYKSTTGIYNNNAQRNMKAGVSTRLAGDSALSDSTNASKIQAYHTGA